MTSNHRDAIRDHAVCAGDALLGPDVEPFEVLNLPAVKIASPDWSTSAAGSGRPSRAAADDLTGAATLEEIDATIGWLRNGSRSSASCTAFSKLSDHRRGMRTSAGPGIDLPVRLLVGYSIKHTTDERLPAALAA